jgi:hypothetical protein
MSNRKKVSYSIAMSKDDGAIVMVRTRGNIVEVMGSMTREQSLDLVKGIMEWTREVIQEDSPRIMRLNG